MTKNIEPNNSYTITEREGETKIVFSKGCVIDYENLWSKLVDSVIQSEKTEVVYNSNADAVKFNKRLTVVIK